MVMEKNKIKANNIFQISGKKRGNKQEGILIPTCTVFAGDKTVPVESENPSQGCASCCCIVNTKLSLPLKHQWVLESRVPLGSTLHARRRRGELSKETFLLKRKILSIVVW